MNIITKPDGNGYHASFSEVPLLYGYGDTAQKAEAMLRRELAREDSPEGAAIRDRLGRMGADSAFDRAEVLLERRERAAQEANAHHQRHQALQPEFSAHFAQRAS